jgi:hypothetical protein
MLDELIEQVGVLPPQGKRKLEREVMQRTKRMAWVPNPGFQTEAYFSEADETGCGGEAGPGKTDLALGLSLNEHRRALLLRRTHKEADKLQPRLEEILKTREGWNGKGFWTLPGGRRIDIGGCQLESDKQNYKGDPHDLIVFDQVEDFTQSQFEFIIAWNRSTIPGQRCRIMTTLNPPTQAAGMWVMSRYGPWLDPKHPHPAKSGELRWYTTIDAKDTEVDGPGPHLVEGRKIMAKSRTFIRGHLWENPDLAGTGYEGRLAGLPEELRAAYMQGSFEASLRDAPNQVIPTTWVKLAQKRWTELPPVNVPMCSMGVDCSGGGRDPLILARRYDGWYDTLVKVPGKEIPVDRIGSYCAGIIVSYREDKAMVVIDMGGGYGSSTYEHCNANDIESFAYKGAERTDRRSADKRLRFVNVRSAAHWMFREALDPDQPGGSPIALPDDPELVADLTTPTFEATPNGIKIEEKEKVTERLGRSTDSGDAVIMSWWAGPKEINSALDWATRAEEQGLHRGPARPGKVILGREAAQRARGR